MNMDTVAAQGLCCYLMLHKSSRWQWRRCLEPRGIDDLLCPGHARALAGELTTPDLVKRRAARRKYYRHNKDSINARRRALSAAVKDQSQLGGPT